MWSYLLLFSSLSGTVLDGRNLPIEGAVVIVARMHDEPASGISDAKGHFEVAVEGSRPLVVEAHAPGYAVFRAGDVDPAKPLSIVLERAGGSLNGIVRDGDSLDPIDGAIVETRTTNLQLPSSPRLGLFEAVTNERGEFRLEGLGGGSYSLSASAPGYGRAVKTNVAPEQKVELYLFPGAGLYGRLIDEKGDPVEGAYVSSSVDNPMSPLASPQASDGEGRFALLGLEPGRYRLFVYHEDFAPLAYEVDVTSERDVEIELTLFHGVALKGRLIDENEEGLSGKVSIRSLDGGGVIETIRAHMTSETDEEGYFSLASVPPGEHTLRAEAAGYGRKDVDVSVSGRAREEDAGEIVLETGLSIAGRVVDQSNTPIAEARVIARKSPVGMLGPRDESVETSSDSEGRFLLAGLAEGVYTLFAGAPGFGSSEPVIAEPGKGVVTFLLKRAGSIRGTVVDPDGRPLPSFQALARTLDGIYGGMHRAEDEAGALLLENVAEGEYVIEIQAADLISEAVSEVRVSPGEVTEIGTIRLRRGGMVEGTVVDSSSEPVPGASISVRGSAHASYNRERYTTTSDRLGRFRIGGVADGTVQVHATRPGYAENKLDRVAVDSRSGPTEVEIVMRRGGSLEGYVRSRDGTDVSGRTVQVIPNPGTFRGQGGSTARTSQDGFFRFEHLPEGAAEVQLLWSAHAVTYAVQRKAVTIEEGETRFVEFLSRRVLVSGQVTRRGTPLPGVNVELRQEIAAASMRMFPGRDGSPRPPGPQYLTGVTGADGYYELLADEPGAYRVHASAQGVALPSKAILVPDADSFSLDLDFGGATVSGRVIDEKTEAPIGGAYVSARRSGPGNSSGSSVRAGADGAFELDVEPGDYVIVARAEGFGYEEKKVNVAEGSLSDVVLSLSTGLRISGRVVDASGRGVGNLMVFAVEDSPDLSAISTRMSANMSVADGRFVIDGLPAGRYNVFAGNELAGFALASAVASGAEDLELRLEAGGKIEVRVVSREGNPIGGAIVGVAAIGGRKVRGVQRQTDENGRISLAVPRGNLTLKASVINGPEALATAAVSGAALVPVEIVLEARP